MLKLKKLKRVFFVVTYVFLVLYFLWVAILRPVIDEYIPMGPIYTDVSKRIESPDYSRMALLIRRNAWDLNYAIKMKKGLRTKTLHWTRDFVPKLTVDWDEKLIWSDDSSFLVFIVDDATYGDRTYMWAYDFTNNTEYRDNDMIINTLNSRSKTNKINLIED